MDGGAERIEDEAELRQVRAQARRVHLQSWALALAATALVYVVPSP